MSSRRVDRWSTRGDVEGEMKSTVRIEAGVLVRALLR